MIRYNIYISEPAEHDLRDIVRYISAQLLAPITALQMMDAMNQAISNLAEMPHQCPLIADERFSTKGYRKRNVKNYGVFFTVDEKNHVVNIERILYIKQNWRHIL